MTDEYYEAPPHEVVPRDAEAAAGLAEWDRLDEPAPDYREQCFFHKLPEGRIAVLNRKLGVKVTLVWNTDVLPDFVQWKNCLAGAYALGLEPTNASLRGRSADIADGVARRLAPGEAVHTRLEFHFETI